MAATRKDYEKIAEYLEDMGWNFKHTRQRWMAWMAAVRATAHGLARYNSNFDMDKFMQACGVWDENGDVIYPKRR